jgi:methionine-rich copper-binding protein CopC
MRRASLRSLGAVAALLAALLLAPSAHAHDYLVSSSPEQGATLAEAPTEVMLEFNTSIGQQFAQVAVVGTDGTGYAQGDPTVDGAVVTQAVADLPAGAGVTISYRVVSSDGHPIGGTVTFSIEGEGDEAAPAESTSESPDSAGTAAADTTATTATSQSTSDGGVSPLVWLGLAAVAVLASLGLAVVRRRWRSTATS